MQFSYNITYKGQDYSFENQEFAALLCTPENTTKNLEEWLYLKGSGTPNVPDFDDEFTSSRDGLVEAIGEGLEEEWTTIAMGRAGEADVNMSETGTIYEVPGKGTPSGDPYVGRHNQPDPAKTRASTDGRDRKQAKVINTYDPNKPEQGSYKEQKEMDARGGIKKLDNKRREVNPLRMEKLEEKYGKEGSKSLIILPKSKSQKKKEADQKRLDQTLLMNHG